MPAAITKTISKPKNAATSGSFGNSSVAGIEMFATSKLSHP